MAKGPMPAIRTEQNWCVSELFCHFPCPRAFRQWSTHGPHPSGETLLSACVPTQNDTTIRSGSARGQPQSEDITRMMAPKEEKESEDTINKNKRAERRVASTMVPLP